MMNYNAALRVLESLMIELRQKDVQIPPSVVEDIKCGRTMVKINKPPENHDTAKTADFYLQTAEANLLSSAEAAMGKAYADEWQRRLLAAYAEEMKPAAPPHYLHGIPKGDYWIRIQMDEFSAIENLEGLSARFGLGAEKQDDGYWLIRGKKADVSALLKDIREKVGRKLEHASSDENPSAR